MCPNLARKLNGKHAILTAPAFSRIKLTGIQIVMIWSLLRQNAGVRFGEKKMRLVAALSLLFIQALSFASPCETAIAKAAGTDRSWRSAFSHPMSDGTFIPTDATREKNIMLGLQQQVNELNGVYARGHNDTPPMIVVPTAGTNITFTKKWEEYGDMHAKVTGAKDGFIHATVLLPVSGHTGLANARKWSTTDTFTLTITDSNGKETPLISTSTKSLDLVTAQDVLIPVEHGKTVTLQYYRNYPSHSGGGPGGYAGGRVLNLTFDKNEPVGNPTDYSEPFWIKNAANP